MMFENKSFTWWLWYIWDYWLCWLLPTALIVAVAFVVLMQVKGLW